MYTTSTCERASPEFRQALCQWFTGEAGRPLLQAEQALLRRLSEGLFGYYLVDIQGVAGDLSGVADCPVREKLRLGTGDGILDIRAEGERLPLRTDAIDVAVLHHGLDYALDPQQVLREVERVLIPEGRVLIVGFNPFSLWGIWRWFLKRRGQVPWCGHFLSYRRVADWLGLLGFDIEYTDVTGFGLSLAHAALGEGPPGRFERLARRLWPMFAGVYVIRAVKRVSTVTPIRPRWRALGVLSPRGVIEPSARGAMKRENDRT